MLFSIEIEFLKNFSTYYLKILQYILIISYRLVGIKRTPQTGHVHQKNCFPWVRTLMGTVKFKKLNFNLRKIRTFAICCFKFFALSLIHKELLFLKIVMFIFFNHS